MTPSQRPTTLAGALDWCREHEARVTFYAGRVGISIETDEASLLGSGPTLLAAISDLLERASLAPPR